MIYRTVASINDMEEGIYFACQIGTFSILMNNELISIDLFLLQFIVVSLKDGMFNNANVLFKTKFVDGVSTVTRYVQHGRSTSVSNNVADKENNHNSKKKQQAVKRTRLE